MLVVSKLIPPGRLWRGKLILVKAWGAISIGLGFGIENEPLTEVFFIKYE
jgi:hypothetical protein